MASIVQVAYGNYPDTTCTFANPVADGNTILVIYGNQQESSVLYDNGGENAYTTLDQVYSAPGNWWYQIGYCLNSANSPTTIGIEVEEASTIIALEISGITGVDVHGAQYCNSGTVQTTPDITPTANGDFILDYCGTDSSAATPTVTSPFTSPSGLPDPSVSGSTVGYYTQPTAAEISGTFDWSATDTGYAGIVAFTTSSSAATGSLDETFSDFTLDGTGAAIAAASLSEPFTDFTLSASGATVAAGSLAEAFGDFTLDGTGAAIASAALAEAFGAFTLDGAGNNPVIPPRMLWGPTPRFQMPGIGSGSPLMVQRPQKKDDLHWMKIVAAAVGVAAGAWYLFNVCDKK
jgi:hypothetical protein